MADVITLEAKQEKVIAQYEEARKEIKTDHYQMSIGELINLYKEGDLTLNPAYQRLFRWNDEQKTKFIESLILGIPIPPIFVAQKADGTWDIVDGLQRISTILQLTGDLENKDALVLTSCKYIPSLEELTWDNLPAQVCRIVKRSRLTINIILTENSIQSQYELFQRLNTGGLHLSAQEIRNCLIIMSNKEFYDVLERTKSNSHFINVTPLGSDKISEEYRMELMIRYFISKNNKVNYDDYKLNSIQVSDFLDTETLALINDENFDLANEVETFMTALEFLNGKLENKVFAKYNVDRETFEGGFSLSMYEAFMGGFVSNFDKFKELSKEDLITMKKEICSNEEFIHATRRGNKALKRFKGLSTLSFNYFDSK